ncbi:signal protein [Streptomyces sp. NPDC048258]|uniref:signal protein n=1 Tax=Streptomyces sp. NPDC048258 TaxID=3365527 RepID=UPI00371CD2C0
MRIPRSSALVAGAALLAAACSAPTSSSSGHAPEAGRPSSPSATAVAGRLGAAEIQGRWWNWAAASPARSNPVADRDGAFCAEKQPDDVWFLAGSFGETVRRTCRVPAGRPVAFPLVNLFGDRSDCTRFMEGAKGGATLDGKQLEAQRYEATGIQLKGVEGNPVTQDGSALSVRACGLWVQLDPLPPGAHTLQIEGSSGSFAVSVGYELQVG